MKTRQIHGLGLGEFLIFAPAKEMLKSAYFFSALSTQMSGFFSLNILPKQKQINIFAVIIETFVKGKYTKQQ